jgi:peptidoglycan/LPS O-acetylase OafA/YrhL
MQKAKSIVEIRALTGLRAIASWWVLLFHTVDVSRGVTDTNLLAPILRNGWLGVDLFFVLSGFVIALNYHDRLQCSPAKRYREFLWARVARLYPVHLVCLLCSGAMWLVAKSRHIALNNNDDWYWSLDAFVRNIFMIHYWTFPPKFSWNGPAWSISCEWLAYILAPTLAILGRRLSASVVVITAMPIALLSAGAMVFQLQSHLAAADGLVRIAVEFVAGWGLYLAHRRFRVPTRLTGIGSTVAVLGAGVFLTFGTTQGAVPNWATLPFSLLIFCLANGGGLIGRLLSTRWLLFWGRASYSVYMSHALVAIVFRKLAVPRLSATPGWITWVIVVAACGLVGALVYQIIEEPARKRMRKFWTNHYGADAAG